MTLSLSILSCGGDENESFEGGDELKREFSVEIYDSDYSQASSRKYRLASSSLQIVLLSGVVGEGDSIVYERLLSKQEKLEVKEFVTAFPLTTLQNTYVTPAMSDGDQKVFVFAVGKIKKQVKVANYYQEDLGALINLMNGLVPNEFKISYVAR
jgi:hypothetical protein